jgi:hypothetical protein
MTEDQFSKKVKNHIEKALREKGFSSIKIKEKVNILNSLAIGKVKSKWKIVLGFLEQDLVLYEDEININELKSEKIFIPRATKDKKIIIPLAILEVKIGKNIQTHHFITYGSIAREIKSVFPNCAYYFISSGSEKTFSEATLLKHARYLKEFDGVFMEWEKDKERVIGSLVSHLERIKSK